MQRCTVDILYSSAKSRLKSWSKTEWVSGQGTFEANRYFCSSCQTDIHPIVHLEVFQSADRFTSSVYFNRHDDHLNGL